MGSPKWFRRHFRGISVVARRSGGEPLAPDIFTDRARRPHDRTPGLVVIAGGNSGRLFDTAAGMLEAEKELGSKVVAGRRFRVIPPQVGTGGAVILACLAPLVALR